MGEIYSHVTVTNFADPTKTMKFQALVDTGASYLTLPAAWKEDFGELALLEPVEVETATQEIISGEVCGPVKIQIEGFRPVANEVLFIDMEPQDGNYEPLLGHLVLQQAGIAVDMLSHRLFKGRALLKSTSENDGTEEGIAAHLERAGVPKDHIVLGFRRPELRQYTEYAAA